MGLFMIPNMTGRWPASIAPDRAKAMGTDRTGNKGLASTGAAVLIVTDHSRGEPMAKRPRTIMWNKLFALSRDDALPLQFQLRSRIVDTILAGTLPPGTTLPSSRVLAGDLAVSRNTVILSYQQLVDDGYLVSRERSGFVVADRDPGAARTPAPRAPSSGTPDWGRRLRLQASTMRSIEKPSDWRSYRYPFLFGQFDPSIFPLAAWRQCCRQALGVLELRDWGRDTIDEDDPLLIEQLRSRVLPRRGIWADPSEIMVTLGTQQALYLIGEALLGPGTTIGVEDPGYPDIRNIAAIRQSRVQPLRVDGHGLCPDAALAQCDYAHVTPNHQCPTTATMPLDRRAALLAAAGAAGTVLIEDDYDCETDFSGTTRPSLRSLDTEGRVIYVSSLSKTLAPGLRLGFIVADAALIRELRALRRLMVRHPPLNNQRAVALFLSLGHYELLVARLTETYRRRADRLAEALTRHVPEARFTYPSGGASIWLRGPPGFDARRGLDRASRQGLLFETGDIFFADPQMGADHIRLGYSVIPEEAIGPGIAELGRVIAAG
jgi:GntR family transcriptional regulator / MocR family aminotransferase